MHGKVNCAYTNRCTIQFAIRRSWIQHWKFRIKVHISNRYAIICLFFFWIVSNTRPTWINLLCTFLVKTRSPLFWCRHPLFNWFISSVFVVGNVLIITGLLGQLLSIRGSNRLTTILGSLRSIIIDQRVSDMPLDLQRGLIFILFVACVHIVLVLIQADGPMASLIILYYNWAGHGWPSALVNNVTGKIFVELCQQLLLYNYHRGWLIIWFFSPGAISRTHGDSSPEGIVMVEEEKKFIYLPSNLVFGVFWTNFVLLKKILGFLAPIFF